MQRSSKLLKMQLRPIIDDNVSSSLKHALSFGLRIFRSTACSIYEYSWKVGHKHQSFILVFKSVFWGVVVSRHLTRITCWTHCAQRYIWQRHIYPFFLFLAAHPWHQSCITPSLPQFAILTKILNSWCCKRRCKLSLNEAIWVKQRITEISI